MHQLHGRIILLLLSSLTPLRFSFRSPLHTKECDSVNHGYSCEPRISHFWGQYSPYFSVPSEIPDRLPESCEITFVQLLSRHGARYPTDDKGHKYSKTVTKIKQKARKFRNVYSFLGDYQYKLGTENLTTFGQQQMQKSGQKFHDRYKDMVPRLRPFVRAAGSQRVVDSARHWLYGCGLEPLHAIEDSEHQGLRYPIIEIPEGRGSNNTLAHSTCNAFDSTNAEISRMQWRSKFNATTKRLNKNLKGANLDDGDTVNLMELCPFETVASSDAALSKFCRMFSPDEFEKLDYYESLEKYYAHGAGNYLGPVQGAGYVNELIARLKNQAVNDTTSTNQTLDSDPATFPLGPEQKVFADFSHDNTMTSIFFALNLFNETKPLSNTTLQTPEETQGYSASWTVPFAARAYIEKMKCAGAKDELVRVLVNDRVMPLKSCGADELGRCTLYSFVDSLGFAKSGGNWEQCFVE